MRLTPLLACVTGALLLAGCSSAPDRYSELNQPGLYSDSATGDGAIPPSARARRNVNPYPNSQGVSNEVRAAVNRRERAFAPDPEPIDGYYGSPQARAQINDELDAEYQSRDEAFGNTTRGQPRPVDLGPGPGLARINPGATYDSHAQVYQSADNNLQVVQEPLGVTNPPVPEDAPPLPDNARPGQCFVLVEHTPRYRTETERIKSEPESTYWRSNCAPADRVPNSTGQTACLVRDPARYETVTRQVALSSGGYEWRETPCGSSGNSRTVLNLQRALHRAGYNAGPVDGIFGPKTRRAANAYQRDRGLAVENRMSAALLRDLGVSPR